MKKTLIIAMLFVSAARLLAEGPDIEKKIALEANLENRLKSVLTEITGTDKLLIIVSLQMVTEKDKKETDKKQPLEILPGVPYQGKIGDLVNANVASMDLGERSLIKKITATIIFDKAIPKAVEETAKQVTIGLLGIDETRGDKLIIQKMSFQKNPFYWGDLAKPPHLYFVIGLFFSVLFIIFLLLFFFGPFQKRIGAIAKAIEANAKAKASPDEENQGPRTSSVQAGASPMNTGSFLTRQTAEKEAEPFSFVSDQNIQNVIYALKESPPERIAVVLNYIPPELASKVISSFPAASQVEILKKLSGKTEYGRNDVTEMEALLKEKTDFTIGGAEKVSELAPSLDLKVFQDFSGAMLREKPEIASAIEKMLVKLEDIAGLTGQEITLLIREFGLGGFAQVMKPNQEILAKVMAKLPKGMQDRLKQEIEFLKPVPEKRLLIERNRFINLAKRLIAEGMIGEIRK